MIFDGLNLINGVFVDSLKNKLSTHPLWGSNQNSNKVKVYRLYENTPTVFPSIGVNTDFSGDVYTASFENRDIVKEISSVKDEACIQTKQYSWTYDIDTILYLRSLSNFELDTLSDYIICLYMSQSQHILNPYGAVIKSISADRMQVERFGNKNSFSRELKFGIRGSFVYNVEKELEKLESITIDGISYYGNERVPFP